jgi:hypothetical protein
MLMFYLTRVYFSCFFFYLFILVVVVLYCWMERNIYKYIYSLINRVRVYYIISTTMIMIISELMFGICYFWGGFDYMNEI